MHPWQRGSSELILFALEQLHQGEGVSQRVAFLLLDVGVETLFKTFLTLPDNINHSPIPFGEREEAAQSRSFHTVLAGIVRAAGPRLQGLDMNYVQHYHGIRNRLYHQGIGITVPRTEVVDYARLAVQLLDRLLGVDLQDALNRPSTEAELALAERARQEQEYREQNSMIVQVELARRSLADSAERAIERIYPELVKPSFMYNFRILQQLAKRNNFQDEGTDQPVATQFVVMTPELVP